MINITKLASGGYKIIISDTTEEIFASNAAYRTQGAKITLVDAAGLHLFSPSPYEAVEVNGGGALASMDLLAAALDGLGLGFSKGVPASSLTTWTDYSLTIDGSTTAPTLGTTTANLASYRVVDKTLFIKYSLRQTAAGTAGSGKYLFPLPAGFTIDTSKVTIDESNDFGTILGQFYGKSTGSIQKSGVVLAFDSTKLWAIINDAGTTGSSIVGSGSGLTLDLSIAVVTEMSFDVSIPIA